MTDWVEEQIDRVRRLSGRTINRIVAVEMALREEGPDGFPQFEDPAIPFLQLYSLYLELEELETVKFITYQNDDTWGLLATTDIEPGEQQYWRDQPADSIYRYRELHDFPRGRIDDVSVALDEKEDIAEVLLCVGGKDVLLVAGEVYETWGDALEVVKGDESILMFKNPSDIDRVQFKNC
jgi:hypothetical protein